MSYELATSLLRRAVAAPATSYEATSMNLLRRGGVAINCNAHTLDKIIIIVMPYLLIIRYS